MKKRSKAWVKMIAFQLLFIMFFMIVLHDTRIKDENNTETIVGVLEGYSVDPFRPLLYLTVDGETYLKTWRIRSLILVVDEILADVNVGDIVCLTVQKNRDILYFRREREVVAFEANGVTIYDIADHNRNMWGARIGLYIFAPLVWIAFTFGFGLMIAISRKSRKRKRKKKQYHIKPKGARHD